MKYAGKSDVGAKRSNNQDSFAVISKDNYICAVVCDGMGGAKGGNIASGLAVKTFAGIIKKVFLYDDPDTYDESRMHRLIIDAITQTNKAVYDKASATEELEGMGTTLVAVISCLCGTFAINIGDSRIYKQTDGLLKQITTDHSFVQYLIDRGEITPEQAASHPNKNIILRALGVNEKVECDIYRVGNYDRLLLCTDGLTNHLCNSRISEILSGNYITAGNRIPSLKSRTEKLISEANENGGSDNITAVILENE